VLEEADVVAARLRAAGCVFAEDEAAVLIETATSPAELDGMVSQRVSGLPLEQVVGWAEFCGLRLAVEPGVFVPRRRTEALAREAITLARAHARPVVVDLCCGVGALAAVVSDACRDAEVYAVDVEPAAVRCARGNLAGVATVLEGDLDEPLPTELGGRVDVLVANVPYVPTDEIQLLPAEARLHEPRVSLDGGEDGLRVFERVAGLASRWLAPAGAVLSETSERQAPVAAAILAAQGLSPRIVMDDHLGATVVVGQAGGSGGRWAGSIPGTGRPVA
jgi:release factor glutamine methyltransferase